MKEGMKKVDQHANTSEKVASCPARDKCKKLEMIKKKKKKKKMVSWITIQAISVSLT